MKRLLCLFIVLTTIECVHAQQKHIIQRGENPEIIARKYGVSVNELKAANPNESDYLTGMTITVPAAKVASEHPKNNRSPSSKPKKKGGFWEALGNTLIGTAYSMRQANAQQRLLNYGTQQTAVPINGSIDYLLDPRYAMMKVQQKAYDEYLLFTGGGKTITYEEYQRQKAQEAAQWEATKRMLESVPDEPTTKQKETEDSHQRTPSARDCRLCGGTGRCNTCNGSGYRILIGIGSGTHVCPNCKNHIGLCSSCRGTGKNSY